MFCVLIPFDRLGVTPPGLPRRLARAGIATGLSYEASHLTTVGRGYGYSDGQFPNAERIARETVTLPLHAS